MTMSNKKILLLILVVLVGIALVKPTIPKGVFRSVIDQGTSWGSTTETPTARTSTISLRPWTSSYYSTNTPSVISYTTEAPEHTTVVTTASPPSPPTPYTKKSDFKLHAHLEMDFELDLQQS